MGMMGVMFAVGWIGWDDIFVVLDFFGQEEYEYHNADLAINRSIDIFAWLDAYLAPQRSWASGS